MAARVGELAEAQAELVDPGRADDDVGGGSAADRKIFEAVTVEVAHGKGPTEVIEILDASVATAYEELAGLDGTRAS